MSYNLRKFVQEEIDSGIGDIGRLQYILDSLDEDKTLYQSDQKYLEARISKHAKKMTTLKNETENVFQNSENQNIIMMKNLPHYHIKSGQDQQTTIFLNKSEMIAQSDMQKTLIEAREKLENVLERIEKFERNLGGLEFELIAPEVEQNYLSNELRDFTEKQKLNNTKVKLEKNKNKQKMDKNLLIISKVLVAMTIVTIVPTLAGLWFFGILEGKLTWQNHEITYSDISAILHLLLFALIFILMAWAVFVILSMISNKKTKNQSQVMKL
ncbi:MAG TPA: hypothetical protein VNX68_19540 [Nitrosopumilaceae archaeon]|nr:hypothetical protein [Nitrosopumilaceae archaeon]